MPKKPIKLASPSEIPAICTELVALQRMRRDTMAMRVMQSNGLLARVACSLGYSSGLGEDDREKLTKAAKELIKSILNGEQHRLRHFVMAAMVGIESLEDHQKEIEKEMVLLMKRLPVYEWINRPCMRGIGVIQIASIIGESGDISNYATVSKLWKRLGCAPHTFDGKTLMGSTWKYGKEGKLPSEEWERFGYSPRRRSLAYLLGENIVKQNFMVGADDRMIDAEQPNVGPYRACYESAKAKAAETHPDWRPGRCNKHAMLLATKLVLKHLWCFWHNKKVETAAEAVKRYASVKSAVVEKSKKELAAEARRAQKRARASLLSEATAKASKIPPLRNKKDKGPYRPASK